MRLIHTCVSYILLLSFGFILKAKIYIFTISTKFSSHQKTDNDTLLQCSNPNNTTCQTNENHKKQHSGKMKSNHHLPEFDSVFFSSEKKKSDSEFIFFFSEFISPSLRSIATKAPEVPVQLFRVFPF